MSRLRRYLVPALLLLPVIFVCGKLLLTPVIAPQLYAQTNWELILREIPFGRVPPAMEQGWPWTYRDYFPEPVLGQNIVLRWSWPLLVTDFAVLLAAVGVAVALIRYRRRSRRGFQFSLRTLLVLIAVSAIGCGWLAHHYHQWNREQQHIRQLEPRYFVGTEYRGPQWLRRIGVEPIWFQHVTEIYTPLIRNDADMCELASALRDLPDVGELDLGAMNGGNDSPSGFLVKPGGMSQSGDNDSSTQLTDISALGRIEYLEFRGLAANDDTLKWVARLPRLRSLDLYKCQISAVGLQSLSPCKGLTQLRLTNNAALDVNGARQIAKLSGLRKLDLDGTALTDEGLNELTAIRSLEELVLSCTEGNSDLGLAPLPDLHRLHVLDLACAQLSDSVVDTLVQLKTLKKLRLCRCPNLTDRGVRRMLELPNLEYAGIPQPPQISPETIRLLKSRIEKVEVF